VDPLASPYERAVGSAVERLHPRLRAYFSAIPAECVGRGVGVFDVVGTPRRWAWPALAVLARWGVVFPVWEQEVPFTVENRATASGSVSARRVFELRGGVRTMVDSVAFTRIGLVDTLGAGGHVRAVFTADVVGGALVLESTRVGIAMGRMRVSLPRVTAPRVRLVERFDETIDRQRVAVTIDLPVIGRIYEYSGSFEYVIERER
jgi:hypothetical protein